MQQGYLKITMKCHLKQNDHSFYHHIPIFNYGDFSYYAYITLIILINTMCHGEMQTKCFLHFLEKILCNNSQFTHPSSLPIHNRFLHVRYVSTRSHPSEVYANMTLRWLHHSSWSSYGQITCWASKHAFQILR